MAGDEQALVVAPQIAKALSSAFIPTAKLTRFVRFGLVGVVGLAVNSVSLLAAVQLFRLHYLMGVVIATQISTILNFILTDAWVFRTEFARRTPLARFSQFWLLNNTFLVLRGPIIWLLTSLVSMHYIVSNLLSLVLILLIRYAVAERLIWGMVSPGTATFEAELSIPATDETNRSTAPTTPGTSPDTDQPSELPKSRKKRFGRSTLGLLIVSVPALILRLAFLDTLGFNSDEAVYAGQAASLAGDQVLLEYFPIFRAHPLLFQTTLSIVFKFGVSPLAGRLLSVGFGLATIGLCYVLGRMLYDRRTGFLAALILGVMPYHVVVTRQVLLDGPMVFFSTLTLCLLALYATTGRSIALYAAAAAMALTTLTNERSLILLGGAYLFFALVPTVTVRLRQIVISAAIFIIGVSPYPLSIFFSGKSATGEQFLAWQLFRRANHGYAFYPTTVPPALGWATLIAATSGLILLRSKRGWRETLIGCWCIVPLLFFEIWSVKGFQYLLALAPPVAVLAARALAGVPDLVSRRSFEPKGLCRTAAVIVVIVSLALTSWGRVSPAQAGESFLAGSGGVPGGREAGEWVGANLPEGAQLLAVGPSMANIIQWYGDRKTYGLSVSPNPLHRNPVYEPIVNPDLLLRNGELHYLVWDSYSASRSPFFSDKLLTFAERFHGRIVHQEFIEVTTTSGERVEQPVIVIYEVRP